MSTYCRFLTVTSLIALSSSACSQSPATNGGGTAGTSASAGSSSGGGGASAGSAPESGSAGVSGGSGGSAAGSATGGGGSTSAGSGGGSGTAAAAGSGGAAGGSSGTGCNAQTLCWDFEEGKLPTGWTKRFDEGGNGQLLVDDSKAFGGSKYALHAKGLTGGEPKKTIVFNLPSNFGPVLWGRARVYTSPTRPDSHAGLFAAYYPPVGSTSTAMNTLDWYEVASYTQAYMSIWHPPWPPGYPESVQVSDTKLVLDEWTCLEWQFDGQNGTEAEAARPRMWLNGAELTWPTKFAFSNDNGQNEQEPVRSKATSFTMIETGVTMWQSMPTPNDWWIDDLGVGRQRLGCN